MNRQCVLYVLYRMCGERSLSQKWNGRSDRQYVLLTYCSVTELKRSNDWKASGRLVTRIRYSSDHNTCSPKCCWVTEMEYQYSNVWASKKLRPWWLSLWTISSWSNIFACDITACTVLLYVLLCLTYIYCTLYILYILHTVHTVHVSLFPSFPCLSNVVALSSTSDNWVLSDS